MRSPLPRLTLAAAAPLALLALAPAASANSPAAPPQVRVTAGDVGKSSRVAFNFTPAGGFRVEQANRAVTVVFPGTDLQFAYDAVYPRREASRIVFAGPVERPGAAAFTLRYTCDCEPTVVLDSAQRVLVELRERSAGNAGPNAASARASNAPSQPGPVASDKASRPPIPRVRSKNTGMSGADPAMAPVSQPDAPQGEPPAGGVLAAGEIERLRASLRWAAERGFIASAPPAAAQPADSAATETPPANLTNVQRPSADLAPPPPAEISAPAPAKAELGPDSASAVDPRPAAAVPSTAVAATEDDPGAVASCSDPTDEPAVDWQSVAALGDDFLTALGRQRANLAAEAGPGALEDMALFYLAQGFTHEGLATIAAIEPKRLDLQAAALILVGRGDAVAEFPPELRCGTDAPVWQAAWLQAHAKPSTAAAAEAVDILARFPKYPRTVLAMALAEAALDEGGPALAERLLDLVAPAPGQAAAALVAVLRGRIALQGDQTQRAAWYFEQALAAGGEAARKSQLTLLRHALTHGEPLPPWAETAIQAALFDYRGDRHLLNIALTAADLHVAKGDYAQALEALSDTARRLPDGTDQTPIAARARDILRSAFAAEDTLGDAEALALFARHAYYLGDDETSLAVRINLGRRLLAAGLPSAAGRALAPLAVSEPDNTEVAVLRAEAMLRAGQPEAALSLLEAPTTPVNPRTKSLRHRALVSLGRYSEAASNAEPAAAGGLLWAAGDWQAALSSFNRAIAAASPGQPAEDQGRTALHALAAAYMAGPDAALPAEALQRASMLAAAAGFSDAAAALTAGPLPVDLTLPDAVALVLERSRQVRNLFPSPQPGS